MVDVPPGKQPDAVRDLAWFLNKLPGVTVDVTMNEGNRESIEAFLKVLYALSYYADYCAEYNGQDSLFREIREKFKPAIQEILGKT